MTVMKEIDLLPEWYKSGRRRQISYRSQYIALGCIFVMMMLWNFIATHSVSKAAAQLARAESKASVAESASRQFAEIKSEVTGLQKKAESIEKIDSRIDVRNILAEMSFLIGDRIVLSKVDFIAERFVNRRQTKPNSSSAVRAVGGNFGSKDALSFGDVRFRVVINGVAADAGDVAKLICKLEDSPYFQLVYPSFSRSRRIKVAAGRADGTPNANRGIRTPGKDYQVTEFEMSCYLANYREEGPYLAREVQSKNAER